jgi:hypothetical protein
MPWQDGLDMVRERGDRLTHGRQPFRLHHSRIERLLSSTANAACRPMATINWQVILGEVRHGPLSEQFGRAVGVDRDDADDSVAALHRHADRLADPRT